MSGARTLAQNHRLSFIDNLYAIGTILVLIGHSHSSDWSTFSGTVLEKVINFIYIFHMPLFFFIAGYLFMNSKSMERFGYGIWIKDKALKLLTPYIVLSLLAAIPKYYFEQRTFSGMGESVVAGIISPRAGVWGHFWFIPVLFLVYVGFGLLKTWIDDEKILLPISLVVSTVLYFAPIKTMVLGLSDFKAVSVFFAVGMTVYYIRAIAIPDYARAICIAGGGNRNTTIIQYAQ